MRLKMDPRIQVWFVAFGDVETPLWWQKLLKPGFRHCLAFTYDAKSNAWLLFDPGWQGILIRAIPPEEFTAYLVNLQQCGASILKCRVYDRPVVMARCLMACTSQVCHLLGFDMAVHTPYRLFKALLNTGSTLAFEDH